MAKYNEEYVRLSVFSFFFFFFSVFDWQQYSACGRHTIKAKLQPSVFIEFLLYHLEFNTFYSGMLSNMLVVSWIWSNISEWSDIASLCDLASIKGCSQEMTLWDQQMPIFYLGNFQKEILHPYKATLTFTIKLHLIEIFQLPNFSILGIWYTKTFTG